MGHQRRRYVAAFLWGDGIMSEIGQLLTFGLSLLRTAERPVCFGTCQKGNATYSAEADARVNGAFKSYSQLTEHPSKQDFAIKLCDETA